MIGENNSLKEKLFNQDEKIKELKKSVEDVNTAK